MLENVLDTKVKVRIARLFSKEKRAFQVSDVARAIETSKSRASECLRDLEKSGLLKSKSIGKSRMYELSPSKMAGYILDVFRQDERLISDIENTLKKEIKELHPVSIARFGSSLTGLKPGSDVDFIALFESKVDETRVYEISSKLSEEYGIMISIMCMDVEDFVKKARNGEDFALKVSATHKLVYGKELEGLIWHEKYGTKKP